jgi:hypothetical protein
MAHALPRAGAPLAPPDGSEAAYLAPEGGCLVTLTLVGGGFGCCLDLLLSHTTSYLPSPAGFWGAGSSSFSNRRRAPVFGSG